MGLLIAVILPRPYKCLPSLSLSVCLEWGVLLYLQSLDLCTCTQGASSVFGPYADNKILEFDLMSNKIQFGGVDIFSIGNNGCNCG